MYCAVDLNFMCRYNHGKFNNEKDGESTNVCWSNKRL